MTWSRYVHLVNHENNIQETVEELPLSFEELPGVHHEGETMLNFNPNLQHLHIPFLLTVSLPKFWEWADGCSTHLLGCQRVGGGGAHQRCLPPSNVSGNFAWRTDLSINPLSANANTSL